MRTIKPWTQIIPLQYTVIVGRDNSRYESVTKGREKKKNLLPSYCNPLETIALTCYKP